MSIIRFRFLGDTSSLDDASKKAKTNLSGLKKEFKDGAAASVKWGAAIAAAGVTLSAVAISKSLKAIDTQVKLARSIKGTAAELEVLTQAGGYSGVAVDKIAQATKDLTRRLSQAAGGTGPAVEALERLNLTAEDLANTPLDKRIETINQAILDFIPAAERAAVAGQLFGEEGSLAMQSISPETIRQAAKDVNDFGTAVSQIDAAKVEEANDAMARIGLVVDGVVKKFTVEVAPILTAISNTFTDAARGSEGFGLASEQSMQRVINAVGFVMDAVDGVRRLFVVTGQAIATFALAAVRDFLWVSEQIVSGPIKVVNDLISLMNTLPGVDIEPKAQFEIVGKIHEEMRLAAEAVQAGKDAMNATLNEPLPSDRFKDFVSQAQEAAQQAAEAFVMSQGDSSEDADESGGAGDSTLQDRLDALAKANASEIELARMKFGEEQLLLEEALEAKLLTNDEFRARMIDAENSYNDAIISSQEAAAKRTIAIEKAVGAARKAALGDALTSLTSLMNSENRKMFEVGKAAAISQTIISTYEAAQKSYSSLAGIPIVGPALGAAAAGAAILGGMARVNSIRSQSFGKGGAATSTPTQQVNAESTPVGGGGGESAGSQQGVALSIDPDAIITGRGIISMLEEAQKNGANLSFLGAT